MKELFGSVPELDLDYTKRRLQALSLRIPKVLRPVAPRSLRTVCKQPP